MTSESGSDGDKKNSTTESGSGREAHKKLIATILLLALSEVSVKILLLSSNWNINHFRKTFTHVNMTKKKQENLSFMHLPSFINPMSNYANKRFPSSRR